MSFSAHQRPQYLQKLASEPLDLLIIGGGITGAGIALDAALRGWKVGLVEKKDFASGTSSRSTKLIHGGLRYLKQMEFALVHETGTERAVIHKNAPHLVKPENMLLPIIKEGTLGTIGTNIALWVYDKLAGVEKEEQYENLDATATLQTEPLLNPEGLKGGALYTEYRTDDARLTLAVLKTAVQKGAICVNYAELKQLKTNSEGKLSTALVTDNLTQQSYEIHASVIVNAAGPWVDEVRAMDAPPKGKRLHLTKGVHLVVPYQRFPLAQSVYFDVKDGRMIFAVPRMDKVYIGTTDTHYQGEMHEPAITNEDVQYLLKAVNQMFPSVQLREEDIESGWAGLRPLIHEDGKSPSELSRKDEIFESASGLISIAGGKLTGYRQMAKRVVDKVAENLKNQGLISSIPACTTEKQALVGGEFENFSEISPYILKLYSQFGKLEPQMKQIVYLVQTYGKEAETILSLGLDLLGKGKEKQDAILLAELDFGLANEMVVTLGDFWVRRTGKLYFDRPALPALLPKVAAHLKDFFQWNESKMQTEIQEWEKLYSQIMSWQK